MSVRTFDYLIIGGGTSGCAAAWNLASRFPAARIGLLEEGSSAALSPASASLASADAPISRVPMLALWREALARRGLFARNRTRLYRASADFARMGHPTIREREMPLLRGAGIGGTHLFDDSQYLRGWPSDYRDWDTRGDGWAWKDVLPVFQRMERYQDSSTVVGSSSDKKPKRKRMNESMLQPFFDAEHEELPGSDGPVPLCEANRLLARTELNQSFSEACRMAGLPLFAPTGTVHMGSTGFGLNTSTVTSNGVQFFSSDLLRNIAGSGNRDESNVTVLTDSRVVKLLPRSEETEAEKLRFTRVQCSNGSVFEAAKEVILAAGPIESPALLQRSGIGEGKLLHRAKVPIKVELPAVGSTMCDRPEATLCYEFADGLTESRSPSTPNRRYLYREWRDYRQNLGGGGGATSNLFSNMSELSAFTESPHSPPERPAFMLNFLTFPFDPRWRCPRFYDGYSVRLSLMHPVSRGWVDGVTQSKLHNNGGGGRRGMSSKNDPIISLGMMHTSVDRDVLLDGVEWAQYISSTDRNVGVKSMYAETHNYNPASPFYKLGVDPKQPKTDIFTHTQRSLWIAETGYSSGLNLYGTCPMGTVVDEKCKVLGVEGLRVCGSAIIPVTVSGKISAVSMMTGLRCTDFL